jgi:hypothetical protein
MQFDVGLWDRLFGAKITVGIPGPGGSRKVRVSAKWLAKMQAEGKISETQGEFVTAHILDPMGATGPGGSLSYRTETWTIGTDVPREIVREFADPVSHELFVLVQWKDGSPHSSAVARSLWQQAKAAFDAIDGV